MFNTDNQHALKVLTQKAYMGQYTVKNNCKLTGFLACKITSFGRFSIITVFFLQNGREIVIF